jgi:hypothetical protein
MGGVSAVITTSAMLLHGVMRAQSESRRFFDDERTSSRLARQFRADAHAAARVAAPAGDMLVAFTLPEGGAIEYRHTADRRQIERRLLPLGNDTPVAREDFSFAGPCAAVVTVAERQIALKLGAEGGDGERASPETIPSPKSPAEAKTKPPALVVEAVPGRDLRFQPRYDGEEPK